MRAGDRDALARVLLGAHVVGPSPTERCTPAIRGYPFVVRFVRRICPGRDPIVLEVLGRGRALLCAAVGLTHTNRVVAAALGGRTYEIRGELAGWYRIVLSWP